MKGLFVLLVTASLYTWAIANEIATQEDINPQNGYLREEFLSMESVPIEDNEAFLQEEYFDAGEQGLQRILNHGSSGKRCSGTHCPTTESYNFIVNKVNDTDDTHQWCLTAPGPTLIDYEDLDFHPCDFNATNNGTQLWRFDKYGMIHSQLDDDFCIVVDKGHNIFNNAKIRIAKCTRPKCLKRFMLKGSGDYKYIRTKEAPKYCLTNEGSTAETLDHIVAKKCKNRDDFKWKFQSGNSTASPSEKFWLKGRGFPGCLIPFDKKVNDGNSLELGSCKRIDDRWQEVDVDNVTVIFQTARDSGMCLQAAEETLADGEWMRIKLCNTSEPLQLFEWNGTSGELSISSSSAKYCPTYQGATANKGDTIVIKNCTNIAADEGWVRTYKRSHERKKHPHKKRNKKKKKRNKNHRRNPKKKRKRSREKKKKSCSKCH
eukprot:scaffold30237_cov44-Attheya_sp.AAC.1